MAFRIKHGNIESVIKLASLAGEAQFQRRQEAVAVDIAKSLYAERSRMAMAKFQADVQQQATKERMAWEYKKIQMSQENDFMMMEQLRMQRKQDEYNKQQNKEREFDAVIKAIDDSDWVTDKQKEEFKINAEAKHRMGAYAPQIREQKGMTPMDMLKFQEAGLKSQRNLEDDLMHHQGIVNSYRDAGWRGGGVDNLEFVDDKGNTRPATEQDKLMLGYAKQRAREILLQLRGGLGGSAGADPTGADPAGIFSGSGELAGPPQPSPDEFDLSPIEESLGRKMGRTMYNPMGAVGEIMSMKKRLKELGYQPPAVKYQPGSKGKISSLGGFALWE